MDLQLQNGTSIQVPDDISEEEKEQILNNISNYETKNFEDNQEEEGLVGDWRPEGAKTSWLFDNAVVAPYEASRKFINSTMSLTEGLGDTLGEKTNLGGFRYGKEAENNLMEYVPYDEAVKLGNVKGILAPITGNIGVNDSSHIKGFFYDPDKINPEDNTESLSASFVESGLQFVLGWVSGGKILKGLGVAKQTTTAGKFTKATAQGALADFIGFDELSGRLTDMIIEHYPSMQDTWIGYLQSDPNDPYWEGRMKNTIEGGVLGSFAEVLMIGARMSKGYIAKNSNLKQMAKDEKVIGEAQEAIIKSKGALDKATTISEKMKILNEALDPVVNKNKKPKILNKEQKIDFLNKISKQNLEENFEKWKTGELTAEEAFSLDPAWINIDTFDPKEITVGFLKTIKSMHESISGSYDTISKDFSDEVIKRKSVQEYGSDLRKTYSDFQALSTSTKNTAPLIYAHEMMLFSLVKALPAMQRQVKLGTRNQKHLDETLAYIFSMQKNRGTVASNTGGNLRTFGITKKELNANNIIQENLNSAVNEFGEFTKGLTDAQKKARFLDRLATLDNPSASRKILDFVGKNKTWEVLNEAWINALLSNPKTQLVNAIGNGITAMAKPIEDKLGANISALLGAGDVAKVARYNELSKEAGSTFAGLFRYLSDAIKLGGKAFKKGELILEGSAGLSKIDTGTSAIGGKLGEFIRLPSRALNAGDEIFKQINYRSKLNAIAVGKAHEKGLKGKEFDKFVQKYFDEGFDEFGRGTSDEALIYAREATYTNELTGFSKKFQQAVNEYPFLKQIFPFIRTPFQLAKSVIDRSPVAMTYRHKHLLGQSNDAKMIAKTRGQMAMGSMLFTSAYAMSAMGMLQSSTNRTTGDGRVLSKFKDAEMIRYKKSELNFKPYSFVINGQQIPFGRLDPYGAFFGLVADIQTNYQYLKQEEIERLGADMQFFLFGMSENNPISTLDKAGMVAKATTSALRDNILSKTYLEAVHEIVNAMYSEDDKTVARYFNNKITSFYPNFLAKIVNDPYLRDATTFLDHVKKRTGLGQPPEPRFNFFGKAHKNPEGGYERLFNNFLSPVTITKKEENPLAEEILRLGKAPAVLKKFQDNVDYTEYKFKGKSAYYRLNDLLSTVTIDGLTLEQKLTELIQSDEYKNMSDPVKINKTISDNGEKYTKIEEKYSKYLRKAKIQFNKEKSFFKHVSDDKRNLSEDIKTLANNEGAVTSKTRTNQSLLKKLQGVINF